jgi:hypothetical protein
MFYYIIHHILHYQIKGGSFAKKTNGQKNVTTFIAGSMAWWLLASFLWSPSFGSFVESHFVLWGMRNFFPWLVCIDAVSMSVIYKLYYNRSILCEVTETAVPEPKQQNEGETESSQFHPARFIPTDGAKDSLVDGRVDAEEMMKENTRVPRRSKQPHRSIPEICSGHQ